MVKKMTMAAGVVCLLCCSAFRAAAEPVPEPAGSEETVVLVHGMNRSRAAMAVLQIRFSSTGYETLNYPYMNTFDSLDAISDSLMAYVRENVTTPRYHLVAHSLGNIIIRNAFRRADGTRGFPPGLGRIVMLAPPNHPNKLARSLKENILYELIAGDSGQKLAEAEFYRTLPAPPVEFGVIAGNRNMSWLFDEPNDGKVAVSATRLEGMKDFIVIQRSHMFMMNTEDTYLLIRKFIETGSFR